MRRFALVLIVLAAAGPAMAQDLYSIERYNELRAEQQMASQRAVALENQLSAMDARLRAEQAIRTLQDQAAQPRLRIPSDPAIPPARALAPGDRFASIPDDRLAASNARVRAASGDRR